MTEALKIIKGLSTGPNNKDRRKESAIMCVDPIIDFKFNLIIRNLTEGHS